MREAEPIKRPAIATAISQPLKETQNHITEVPVVPVVPSDPLPSADAGIHGEEVLKSKASEQRVEEEKGEGKEEGQTGSEHRLSNGLDSHLPASIPVVPMADPPDPPMVPDSPASAADPALATSDSPRSSALEESRLSTLSDDKPVPNGLPTEQELTSSGEESSMEAVADHKAGDRHLSVISISEETRELDDYLNRSSVTSVLTDSQIATMQTSGDFERLGSGASEDDLERGGGGARSLEESGMVRIGEQGCCCCCCQMLILLFYSLFIGSTPQIH